VNEISRYFKYTMCIIEQMLCLKINFHKSEVDCLGEAVSWQQQYNESFTYLIVAFL
jgi:hypothetical protein